MTSTGELGGSFLGIITPVAAQMQSSLNGNVDSAMIRCVLQRRMPTVRLRISLSACKRARM